MSEPDADFLSVLQDLIQALLANGTLRLTDLPTRSVERLHKLAYVQQCQRDILNLISDDTLI